ncbi:hypothetical protein D3C75_876060 [compost metagenome]
MIAGVQLQTVAVVELHAGISGEVMVGVVVFMARVEGVADRAVAQLVGTLAALGTQGEGRRDGGDPRRLFVAFHFTEVVVVALADLQGRGELEAVGQLDAHGLDGQCAAAGGGHGQRQQADVQFLAH